MCGSHGRELQGGVNEGSKSRGGGFEGMFVVGRGIGFEVGVEFGFVPGETVAGAEA